MQVEDLLGLLVPVTYFAFLITEKLWPAREFPPRKGWQVIGIAFLLIAGVLSVVIPLLVPQDWLAGHRWVDGSRLGVAGGAVVGFVLLEGLTYSYHRAAHASPLLWRIAHQLHHSPTRVDIPGSVLFHPVELVIQTALQIFITLVVLGLNPVSSAIIGYLFAFYGMFQHWNVKTPVWIGYFIQRPESHCIHHRLGLHYYNFADLPLWDMVFGTFRNPRRSLAPVGFDSGADLKLGAMLAFADVNEALYGPGSRGQAPRNDMAPQAAAG